MSDGRVHAERDGETGIARLTLDNPARRNSYDPAMRRALHEHLEAFAYDDDVKVVVLRGEGGVFSTGADMNNAYAWYGKDRDANAEAEKRAADGGVVLGQRADDAAVRDVRLPMHPDQRGRDDLRLLGDLHRRPWAHWRRAERNGHAWRRLGFRRGRAGPITA